MKRTYGSTEAPTIITDGRADRRRSRLRVDDATASCSVRGPELCVGYLDAGRRPPRRSPPTAGSAPATSPTIDADGTIDDRRPHEGRHHPRRREHQQPPRSRASSKRIPTCATRSRSANPTSSWANGSCAFVERAGAVRPRRVPRLVRRARRRQVQDARAASSSSTRSRCSRPASPTAPRCANAVLSVTPRATCRRPSS